MHDNTFMAYHGLSWLIMAYHGLSWLIMAYHGLSWLIIILYNTIHRYINVTYC